MFPYVVIAVSLLTSNPDSTAAALIQQALECETEGQDADRNRLLELAVQADPSSATARGLLGQVEIDGQWLDPAEAAGREQSDQYRAAFLAQYESRRVATPDTAAAQWKLALWCEQHGLKVESIAHLARVTRLDPSNAAAWHRLGYRPHHGQWLTEEEFAREEAEKATQALADQHWRPLLSRLKRELLNPETQEAATRQLDQVHDPRAVPSVVQVFQGTPRWERWTVYLLGRIDAPRSAQALAMLAVDGQLETTREAAIRGLRSFDPRAYVGLMINWIKAPTLYDVERPAGRNGEAVVRIDDPQARIERHYRAVSVPAGGPAPVGVTNGNIQGAGQLVSSTRVTRLLSNGHYGLFNQEVRIASAGVARNGREDAERARAALGQRIAADLQQIDQANMPINANNLRVLHALYQVTGKAFGTDQAAWTSWWTDQLGYHYSSPPHVSKPLVIQEVATPYVAPPPPVFVSTTSVLSGHSCFAAGTPVQTRSGQRAIEELKVGDQVLTQDTTSGALGFEPILAVLHNPPSRVLRIELDSGESIVATEIHRFWLAGRGWKMTRDLKPGDRLRMIGGTARIVGISTVRHQRVFNLEVA
ncbi:MAG: polymorphic toxin-type HINT domain-containing protein, partial [Isosphaeraceae bacterium]